MDTGLTPPYPRATLVPMDGALRIIPSQPLGFPAPKTASGGKIRAYRIAPERMPRNRLYRLRKMQLCGQTRVGARILGNTIGNAVAGGISGSQDTSAQATQAPQVATSTAASTSSSDGGSPGSDPSQEGGIVVTGRSSGSGYVDYFPEATAALMSYDLHTGGAAYAAAHQKQRIVQVLVDQANAASSVAATGYAAYDAIDGKVNGGPEVGGWAATQFELDVRTAGLESAFGPNSKAYDPNVYGAIQASLAVNQRLIDQWNTIADGEVQKIMGVGLYAPATIAAGAVALPVVATAAAETAGGSWAGGEVVATNWLGRGTVGGVGNVVLGKFVAAETGQSYGALNMGADFAAGFLATVPGPGTGAIGVKIGGYLENPALSVPAAAAISDLIFQRANSGTINPTQTVIKAASGGILPVE